MPVFFSDFHYGQIDRLRTRPISAKVILSSSKGDSGRAETRFDELSMLQRLVAREA
jgi:hypothetical protein